MPQLTIADIVDGAGSLADWINALIDDLETAYNKLDTTNFNSSSNIPNSALTRPKAYFPGQLLKETVPINQTTAHIQDEFQVATDCELVDVRVVASGVAGDTVEVDIWLTRGDPALPDLHESILAAQISLIVNVPSKGTGVPSRTSFLKGDLLSLRAVTGAAETIGNLNATLLFKKNHTT